MSISPKHLIALRCPVTKRPLEVLGAEVLSRLNGRIVDGKITDNSGNPLTEQLTAALITDTGRTIYPIIDGVPILIESNGIAAVQVDDST